jgi:hypothetical protein
MALTKDQINHMNSIVQGGIKNKVKQIPQGKAQPQSRVPGWAKTALPVGGAILGGVAGTALGVPTGPGAVASGVVGAGLGGAAGQSAVHFFESLLGGKPPPTPMKRASEVGQAGLDSAGAQLLGHGAGKVLGAIAHPIMPFTNKVTSLLKKSTSRLNMEDLLKQFKGGTIPNYIEKGQKSFVDEVLPTFEKNLKAAINEIQPSRMGNIITQNTQKPVADFIASSKGIARAGPPIEPIRQAGSLNQTLPTMDMNSANLLKSNYQKGANYNGEQTMYEKLSGDFANIIKRNIEGIEPGVKLPNQIASLLHKVPDALNSLTYASPQYRFGLLLRRVGSLPAKTIQKMFPYGGGYLNKILPILMNMQNFPQDKQSDSSN